MEKKYYITGDLEKTLTWWVKWLDCTSVSVAEGFRKRMIDIIDNSFGSKVTEFIAYDRIVNYFSELQNDNEFIIWLDDWIYIENSDFNYSSTRTYNNMDSILNNPNDYQILQRNGLKLKDQNNNLKESIINSWKKDVIICDDWLYSWDTLNDVISPDIKDLVKEIRVILNFSWKTELNWIPIISMLETSCIDWLDERDLFYWTKNGWASFMNKWKMNWLTYISSPEIASKKASIPEDKSSEFCKEMLALNKDIWFELSCSLDKVINLIDLPRVSYLEDKYDKNLDIIEILDLEKENILLN